VSPVVGVSKPKPPASRDRVLTDQEIVWFWKSCDGLPEPFGPCLKILLLTGARRGEAAGMRRAEFSGSVWTIPGSRSKNHRAHDLPFSEPQISGINRACPDVASPHDFSGTGRVP
jgi:integrase